MDRILIFGDSICYGKWDIEGGWVARLRKFVDGNLNIGKNVSSLVFNLGIPGELVINTAKRFERELLARIKPAEKNLVILAAGVNDSCPNNRTTNQLTPVDDFKQAFIHISEIAKKNNCELIVVGLLPANSDRAKSQEFSNELVSKYDKYISQVTSENSIDKIELFDALRKSNFSDLLVDAVHPNYDGHKIIYEKVLNFLQEKKYI